MSFFEISITLVGTSFFLILIFLLFCYVKFVMEDKFDVTRYKIFKSRMKKELRKISESSSCEFPIVSDTCYYFLNRIEEDFDGEDGAEKFLMDISMKYGDDSK